MSGAGKRPVWDQQVVTRARMSREAMAASNHESVTRLALELKEQDLSQVRREAEKAMREAEAPVKAARRDYEAAIQRAEGGIRPSEGDR